MYLKWVMIDIIYKGNTVSTLVLMEDVLKEHFGEFGLYIGLFVRF